MIEREDGHIVWWCDQCDDDFAYPEEKGEDAFHVGWAAAKDIGWTARYNENGWMHFCPNCRSW